MNPFKRLLAKPGILDWLYARRKELTPAWERINRNALHQWWAKRRIRYLVRNEGPNRKQRQIAAATRRYLRRHGVKL
jgi:hypothetical protein